MKNRLLVSRVVLGLVVVLMFFGCAVKNVHKDESYKKKLTEVSIGVMPVVFPPQGNNGLNVLFNKQASFVLINAPSALTKELAANHVAVLPMNQTQAPALIIRPKNGKRTCTTRNGVIMGCNDEVWYGVYLYEKGDKKVVWSGDFKVGGHPSSYSKERQASTMGWFAKNITKAMKDSDLFQKQ